MRFKAALDFVSLFSFRLCSGFYTFFSLYSYVCVSRWLAIIWKLFIRTKQHKKETHREKNNISYFTKVNTNMKNTKLYIQQIHQHKCNENTKYSNSTNRFTSSLAMIRRDLSHFYLLSLILSLSNIEANCSLSFFSQDFITTIDRISICKCK